MSGWTLTHRACEVACFFATYSKLALDCAACVYHMRRKNKFRECLTVFFVVLTVLAEIVHYGAMLYSNNIYAKNLANTKRVAAGISFVVTLVTTQCFSDVDDALSGSAALCVLKVILHGIYEWCKAN